MPVLFRNPGLVDLRALLTLGVNVKESDSPIGFFGSGAKFAIATLLRLGCSIEVFRVPALSTGVALEQLPDETNLEHHVFTAAPTIIRGKPFDVVQLDGHDLGFTTAFGRNWEAWQAYRELYSNALDEGGVTEHLDSLSDWHPEPGETAIIVSGDAIEAAWTLRRTFLLDSEPLFTTPVADIHPRNGNGIFYRGIRVGEFKHDVTAFTFNLKRSIELTEDRTARWPHQVNEIVAEAVDRLVQQGHLDAAMKVLLAPDGSAEREAFDFDGIIHTDQRSKAFLGLVGELQRTRATELAPSAMRVWRRLTKVDDSEIELFLPTDAEAETLAWAKQLLLDTLDSDVSGVDVLLATHLGSGVLGLARDRKVYLSRKAFALGREAVAGTLFEEWVHVKLGHEDNSREMQNFLLNKLIVLARDLRDCVANHAAVRGQAARGRGESPPHPTPDFDDEIPF